VLGVEALDAQQHSILAKLAEPGTRRVAIKSGHACGKTFIVAGIVLWWYFTRYPATALTTAPTSRQVREVLWSEIHKHLSRAKQRWPIEADPLVQQLKGVDPEARIIGFTAGDDVKFQGFHGKRVLAAVDEASGISPEIWTAVTAVTTGADDLVVAAGNPSMDPGSEFHSAFTRNATEWATFTLDSEMSNWCSRSWISERRRDWGVESSIYRARVKGEIPKNAMDSLIALDWIEAAHRRWAEAADAPPAEDGSDRQTETQAKAMGVDVARAGRAQTVLALSDGRRCWIAAAWQGQDLMRTAGEISRAILDGIVPAEGVVIDDTGLGGGVTDRLREQGFDVVPFNFGADAQDPTRFKPARSELYWNLREQLREGRIDLDPEDTMLLRELCTPKYTMDSAGRIRLEPKDDMIARLGYSPDRADALALAVAGHSLLAQPKSRVGSSAFGSLQETGQVGRGLRVTQERTRGNAGFGRSLRVSGRQYR